MSVITHVRLHTGVGEDYGPRADGFVCLHTWEGDPLRTTVADALAPGALPWQDQDSVLGSYNRVICSDGVISTVRDDHAAGGINPFSAGFRPLPWLVAAADASEVNNPNAFALQLCFFGRKAHYDANGWPPYMIDAAARSWIEEEQRTGRKQVLCNHGDFQPPPERFDAGPIATALVKKRYAELTAPVPPKEDDVIPLKYKEEMWTTRPDAPFWLGGPEQGEQKAVVGVLDIRTLAQSIPPPGSSTAVWRIAPIDADICWFRRADLTIPRPVPTTPVVPADCSVQDAKIIAQAAIIAADKTTLAARNASIAIKNAALDGAVATEKTHAALPTTLAQARAA